MEKKSALQPRIYIAESSPLYIELKSLDDNKLIRNRILTLMSLGVRYEQLMRSENGVKFNLTHSAAPSIAPDEVNNSLTDSVEPIPNALVSNVNQESIVIEANTKTIPAVPKGYFEMYANGGDIFDTV